MNALDIRSVDMQGRVQRTSHQTTNDAAWTTLADHLEAIYYTNTAGPTSAVTYLYRVIAGVTTNNTDSTSPASDFDYATIASALFTDEPLVAGGTTIKGVHVGELRQAIDAVRLAANLPPAWSSHAPATGTVLASSFTDMRQRLDEARNQLFGRGHQLGYSPPAPASGGRINAFQLQEMREGVR